MGWRFILSLGFSIIIALFAIANASPVRVNFIVAVYEVSQAIVILISAIAGAVIVMLLSIVKNIKLKMKIKNQEKTIAEMQKQKDEKETKITELEQKYEELNNEKNDQVLLVEENIEQEIVE